MLSPQKQIEALFLVTYCVRKFEKTLCKIALISLFLLFQDLVEALYLQTAVFIQTPAPQSFSLSFILTWSKTYNLDFDPRANIFSDYFNFLSV